MKQITRSTFLLLIMLIRLSGIAQKNMDIASSYQSIFRYKLNGDKDEATKMFLSLANRARGEHNTEYLTKTYVALSRQYAFADSLKLQMAYADSAMMSSLDGTNVDKAYGYAAKGAAYSDIGNYNVAVKLFDEVLRLLKNEPDGYLLSSIYYNYGVVMASGMHDLPKAIELIKKAIVVSSKIKNYDRLTMQYTFLATLLGLQWKNPQDSVDKKQIKTYLDSAENLVNKYPNEVASNNKQYLLHLLAAYYFNCFPEEDKTAQQSFIYYINKAKQLGAQNNVQATFLIQPYVTAASCYMERKKYDLAENEFRQAYDLLKTRNINAYASRKTILEGLASIYAIRGDYKKAFERQQELLEVIAKLSDLDRARKAVIAEIEMDIEKNKSRVVLLETVNKNDKRLLWLLGSLIVVISALPFFIYKANRLKLKLAIEEQEKIEIEHSLMQTKHQQMQKERISDKLQLNRKNEILDNLKAKIKDSNEMNLTKILNEENIVNETFGQANFAIHNIHPNFSAILNKAANNKLTPLDIKYCLCVCLNMDTKQIAHLLNVEPHSVRVAKYRIKQKLSLNKEKNLSIFLHGLISKA